MTDNRLPTITIGEIPNAELMLSPETTRIVEETINDTDTSKLSNPQPADADQRNDA